ncbi:MAG: S-layer homology domain-containing protein [Oscillospiraceae bacterium]|nr:S-layer homology domain-containing protein [Oscillospiraceae bacterium]
MKRMIALFLAMLMLVSAMPFAGAAFSDADKISEKNREAVNYVSERGIISGFPDGTFGPKDMLTRAQAAKVVCAMLEGTEKANALTKLDTGFSDVPATHWAAKYIAYCVDKGIVAGVGSGKFDPDGKLTSAAFGKMLLVAYGKAKAEDLTGEEWIKTTQNKAKEVCMSVGADVNIFPSTRENACQLAYNFLHEEDVIKALPADYSEITLNFTESGKYRLLGRAEQLSNGVQCNWSADGVEFTAECGGRIYLTASVNHDYWRNHLLFRVIVDGVLVDPVMFDETNGNALTLATPALLQPGKHTVKIIKDSIGDYADDRLISVTFHGKSETIAASQPRPKLLEVIGASTATGAGILPTPKDGRSVGTNNTATIAQTFGYIVAEELNMDLTTVTKGSLGIVARAGSPVKYNLAELYEYTNRYRDDNSIKKGEKTGEPERYGFERKADMIILMINENDKKISSEEWTPATKAFIKRLREINGEDCTILFLYYSGSAHKADIAQVLKDDPKLIGLGIRSNASGSGGHANAAAHSGWAQQILPLLKPYA